MKENVLVEILPGRVRTSPRGLHEAFKNFLTELSRIWHIVGFELRAKIFDKTLGPVWLMLEPIIIAGLYYILTVIIFRAAGETRHFLFIMVSVIFWRWFSRTIDTSPTVINSYGSVLKQTNFPTLSVILIFMGQEFFFLLLGILVLFIFLAFYKIYPTIYLIYLPVVLITQFTFTFWLTLLFSMIGTFLKDLPGFLYAFTSIWWYLSPGIYPISKIPHKFLKIYMLNPFAHILPAYRDILIYGKAPQLIPLFWIFFVSLLLSFLILKIFNRAKYYFFIYL